MVTVRKSAGCLAVIAAAFAAGVLAAGNGVLALGALFGLALVVLAYQRPQVALTIWLVAVIVIPYWTTVYVGVGMPPASALGLPILAGVAAARIAQPEKIRISWLDWSILLGTLGVTLLWVAGDLQGLSFVRDALLVWVLAYIIGRNADSQVTSAFAVIMAFAALWGLVEFMFGLHVFENWFPSATHTLNQIQGRAGVDRSEAAFGHAIAYGASLAMGIPFAQQLRKHSLAVQILLAAGIAVSLSRGPLIALALTLVLMVWVMASTSKLRARYTFLTVLGGGVVYAVLITIYSDAYAGEVSASSGARENQWEIIGPSLNWFSTSLRFLDGNGTATAQGITIIDSAPLRLAANFGIVTAFLLLAPVAVAAWRVLNRSAGPASVALAGQIPVLLVTSFITQWQALIFFVMGLVVTEISSRRVSPSSNRPEGYPTKSARKSYANKTA